MFPQMFRCNPSAVADLLPRDIVLDLGSGGGIDVLLSARRVGPSGHVYRLDMTPDARARPPQRGGTGATNVEFLEGHIEDVPLPDSSVDVIISNCVVDLDAPTRTPSSREMFRVLRPGGRIGVSDVITDDDLSDDDRAATGSCVGCIAGALRITEYETPRRRPVHRCARHRHQRRQRRRPQRHHPGRQAEHSSAASGLGGVEETHAQEGSTLPPGRR